MPATKTRRATVYFDPAVHEALRRKAADTDQSVSDVIGEAVRVLLAEDAEDLVALEQRRGEPTEPFESFVERLRAAGAL